ncbi:MULTISPECIES: IS30 family transposase [unclassified Methylophaga]|jgi:IS30 family transposase|uniref:IS30 family transposase n=1 Tax=unclassified Methylophaga TaxID=2629249 RepID=UPI000C9778A1|nr:MULTISPECIES: IS30 family transposase [unclassified Methylophaga]MAK65591.1 IS30 family transposase [Methylophaga sp.]MAY16314.1 IS30 family transposase [Methylophaga sp.]THK42206.1 IS30 family transposase [Methylophaga sp. SB9B]HAO26010.1 IS30 family transposase [Methylophaga sp.]HCD06073.1 IS30 family transposase [Methylophaga sp.]|tara:strand:- start:3282 stop:4442 length:1161 start_codon:yes stop_codon:yes gene_type:complete
MKRAKRTFTQDEKELVFNLWKQGTGFSDIGRVLDAAPGTVFTALRETGGIKPRTRTRNAKHLTIAEREEIRVALSAKMSLRAIARMLNRSPSTISRKIARNRGRRFYKAVDADNRARRMAKRPKLGILELNSDLRQLVMSKLELKWSPEQISGWLSVEFSRNKQMQVSHETIYKSMYVRAKGVIHHSFTQHLRRNRPMRHSQYHRRSGDRSFTKIVSGLSIHERSKNIDNRKSLGHWEGALVSGSKNTHIATLVDRKSRFTIILKLAGKDAESVHKALLATFTKMPAEYRKSLTWDRGMELAKHADLTKEIGIPVYFCDPQCPWQRGTNENTNSLIRQYFPKKTDLSPHSQERLNAVATQLNERPRKTLKFKTPSHMIDNGVAMIV